MPTADGPRDDMASYLREFTRRIDALERKSSLANTGLTALAPMSVQVDGSIQSANYSSLTAGWRFDGTQIEVTITVPAGTTQLLATASAYVYAVNPNTTGGSNGTGGDAIYAAVGISGQASATYSIGLSGNGGFTTSSAADSFIFTGLTPGSTLRLVAFGAAAYQSMTANTANRATVSATLLWLK